jgi:cell wall-associated NlpC family hydrolase
VREVTGSVLGKPAVAWDVDELEVAAGPDHGWVTAAAFEPDAGSAVHRVYVSSLRALGYAEPTRKAAPAVAEFPMGAVFERLEDASELGASNPLTANHWHRVRIRSDVSEPTLWIQSTDLSDHVLTLETPAASVEMAAHMIGLPYVWAGATSFGYDCSGLVQMLARGRGIWSLPHSAARQFNAIYPGFATVGEDRAIDEKQSAAEARAQWGDLLEPGDFLYFAMGERVDHVGVFAGDGDMIHASSGGVPTTRRDPLWSVSDGRYAASITGVRRVTP